jgi:hypothetical protein
MTDTPPAPETPTPEPELEHCGSCSMPLSPGEGLWYCGALLLCPTCHTRFIAPELHREAPR